jgi:hypothetical protein
MSLATAPFDATVPHASIAATTRDPRLDFFRGLALFVILVVHTPGNPLALWTPGQFGFSDSAEIFVFCSGMSSAFAFGATFRRTGWLIGTAHVAQRIWQVYWTHIAMFMLLAGIMAAASESGRFTLNYIGTLNLGPFFADPATTLVGLLTLTYVPNYFDILPMYMVILAMIPAAMALSRVSVRLTLAISVALWMAANLGLLRLPAEPWSDREWFFNPFAWQLIFFAGFALAGGWLPVPPADRRLALAAAAIVAISVPLTHFRFHWVFPGLEDLLGDLLPWRNKTELGILRCLHFFALAYLAWAAAGAGGWRLLANGGEWPERMWAALVGIVRKVGQHSLIVFASGMVLARLIGMGLDITGRSFATVTLANLFGAAALVLIAETASWYRSHPWRKKNDSSIS